MLEFVYNIFVQYNSPVSEPRHIHRYTYVYIFSANSKHIGTMRRFYIARSLMSSVRSSRTNRMPISTNNFRLYAILLEYFLLVHCTYVLYASRSTHTHLIQATPKRTLAHNALVSTFIQPTHSYDLTLKLKLLFQCERHKIFSAWRCYYYYFFFYIKTHSYMGCAVCVFACYASVQKDCNQIVYVLRVFLWIKFCIFHLNGFRFCAFTEK